MHIAESSVVTTCDTDYSYSAGAYCAIVLISVIAFMVLVGSMWDPVVMLMTSLKVSDERKVLVNSEEGGAVDEIVPDSPAVQSKPVSDPFKSSTLGNRNTILHLL